MILKDGHGIETAKFFAISYTKDHHPSLDALSNDIVEFIEAGRK